MNDSYNIFGSKCYELNRPVENRFNALLKMADDFGYTVFIQHCSINKFGHSDISILCPEQMELLICEAEPIIYEAAIQLRLLV